MLERYTQTVTEAQHAPAVGRTRPGGEFWSPFWARWLPFGSLWLTFGAFFSADVAEACRFLASHLLASSGRCPWGAAVSLCVYNMFGVISTPIEIKYSYIFGTVKTNLPLGAASSSQLQPIPLLPTASPEI